MLLLLLRLLWMLLLLPLPLLPPLRGRYSDVSYVCVRPEARAAQLYIPRARASD